MKTVLTVLLILLNFNLSIGIQLSEIDAPPTILLPANLDNPENLVIIGNNSQLINTLVCSASNADMIEWKYRRTQRAGFETIPKPFNQGSISQASNGDLYVELTDQNNDWRVRDNINGFYQCFAKNNKGYTAMTPPIRFILPAIPQDAEDYAPRAETGNLNAPFRLKCIDDRIITKPDDLNNWNIARYSWQIFYPKSEGRFRAVEPIVEDDRIKIDRRTGDLFFAYLTAEDGLGTRDFDPEYQCMVTLGVKPGQYTGSRTHLMVTASPENFGYRLQAPLKLSEKRITCVDGRECTLSCVYGGMVDRNPPPSAVWKQPGDSASVILDGNNGNRGMSVSFTAITEVAGTWRCGLYDGNTPEGEIQLEVLSYPRIPPTEMLDQYVEVGTEVEFVCNARTATLIEFYINGFKINSGNLLPGLEYRDGSKRFRSTNVQRDSSANVVCLAYNDAGVLFKSANLIVYDSPNITLTPENGYILSQNNTENSDDITMECQALLDPKVKDAFIFWRTNQTTLRHTVIMTNQHEGIESVKSSVYTDNKIRSTITFKLDHVNEAKVVGGYWWCVVNMTMYGSDKMIKVESLRVPLTAANTITKPVITVATFSDWWIIGVIVACVFFILIILLIVCCVKQHQGEDYYVDEKERKAGHDPEKEMGHYGFSDYKRPATGGYMPIHMSDQEPVKNSRTSLDASEKPLDSDRGSMDEYGDIDPGRFNEDGSFIGEYGKSATAIDM